jgi:hypothetical protein
MAITPQVLAVRDSVRRLSRLLVAEHTRADTLVWTYGHGEVAMRERHLMQSECNQIVDVRNHALYLTAEEVAARGVSFAELLAGARMMERTGLPPDRRGNSP